MNGYTATFDTCWQVLAILAAAFEIVSNLVQANYTFQSILYALMALCGLAMQN